MIQSSKLPSGRAWVDQSGLLLLREGEHPNDASFPCRPLSGQKLYFLRSALHMDHTVEAWPSNLNDSHSKGKEAFFPSSSLKNPREAPGVVSGWSYVHSWTAHCPVLWLDYTHPSQGWRHLLSSKAELLRSTARISLLGLLSIGGMLRVQQSRLSRRHETHPTTPGLPALRAVRLQEVC